MKKTLLATVLLSLSLAAAQTAPVNVTLPMPALSDMPADHWAAGAVKLLMERGIILGYPDGTYRGKQTMTRYEVAQVLARVLQQNLLATPSAQAALSAADMDVLSRGVAQVADLLATMDMRLRDAVADIDNLKGRMAATEQALQQVVNVAVTRTELEASVATASAETQTALASKADTSTVVEVQAQIAALQAQITALQQAGEQQAAAGQAAVISAAEQQAMQAAQGINGQVFDDPASVPNAGFKVDALSSLYAGGGISTQLGSGRGFGVVIGSDRVLGALGGLGLRASGTYSDASSSYSVQANLTKNFGTTNDGKTNFSPYAGLGAGVLVSPTPGDKTAAANDVFVSALGGINYNFTETLRLYAEVDGRYYLSGKGVGTGATTDKAGNRIGVGLGAGLKIYF